MNSPGHWDLLFPTHAVACLDSDFGGRRVAEELAHCPERVTRYGGWRWRRPLRRWPGPPGPGRDPVGNDGRGADGGGAGGWPGFKFSKGRVRYARGSALRLGVVEAASLLDAPRASHGPGPADRWVLLCQA
jgi:hypothetical protein